MQQLTSSSLALIVSAYITLGLPLVAAIHWAMQKGWFYPLTEDQKAQYAPKVTHFFTVAQHPGFWALFALNVFLVIAVALTRQQWNPLVFNALLMLMLIASVYFLQGWADADNDPTKLVLSGFSRYGQLDIPGVMLAISGAFAYTITLMYFCTPAVHSQDTFAWWFAIALSVYLLVALLAPPLIVWGKIHEMAWVQAVASVFVVWILYFIRLYNVPDMFLKLFG